MGNSFSCICSCDVFHSVASNCDVFGCVAIVNRVNRSTCVSQVVFPMLWVTGEWARATPNHQLPPLSTNSYHRQLPPLLTWIIINCHLSLLILINHCHCKAKATIFQKLQYCPMQGLDQSIQKCALTHNTLQRVFQHGQSLPCRMRAQNFSISRTALLSNPNS